MNFSKNRYRKAGSVVRAAVSSVPLVPTRLYISLNPDSRPMKRATDVSVPYSDSKRSRSGVRARMFMSVWKRLRWMSGKVFVRYTEALDEISVKFNGNICVKNRELRPKIITALVLKDSQVVIPVLSGMRAPHSFTSHADCRLKTQNRTMTRIIARVKSGNRKTYDLARSVLKLETLGVAIVTGRADETRARHVMLHLLMGSVTI